MDVEAAKIGCDDSDSDSVASRLNGFLVKSIMVMAFNTRD
jgi:hypothetical protein